MPKSASQEITHKRQRWQDRFTRLYNGLLQHLGEILSGVGGIVLTVLGLTPLVWPNSVLPPAGVVIVIAICVLFLGLGWWVRNKQRKLITELENEITARERRINILESRANAHIRLIELIVEEWCREAGLWDSDTRITVYGYDEERDVLRPLVRASNNTLLRLPGREEYPPNHGYIGEVWVKQIACVEACKIDRSKKALKEAGVGDEEIERIMHPRSYAGFRCERFGQSYGIVFIESSKQRLIDNGKFEALLASNNRELVEQWIATEGVTIARQSI